ncbi:phytoene desaturase [Nocardioides sp. HDW12B]|uniref:phytoene desaturase family protein n=1 Tax=Nocardioides sp. HDW12B TaxID=2714939 RepID=UPI00140E21D8|nr:phytoene desaturase family protein [Nocardioides sp. HDW12B]QIK65998.1 phytoene desaturase [Nocardioides sp. HDW12B]
MTGRRRRGAGGTSAGRSAKVVVAGAGLSGLAAACHLRAAGHEVTVLERDDEVGGRAGTWRSQGYRFDTGPVVMTMPELLAEPFAALGVDLADAVPMRRLDPSYRAHFADGTSLDVRADMGDLKAEVARLCSPEEAERLQGLLDWLARLYDVEIDTFLDRNYDSPLGLMSSPLRALELLRLGGLGSLDRAVSRRLHDERLQRVFSFQALYAGVSPQLARAVLAVIAHMDVVRGVHYPEGGMHTVPHALGQALVKAGAEVVTGAEVTALVRGPDGSVEGVRLADGHVQEADAVVCTVDLPVAYRRLLPDVRPPRAVRRGHYSPSAVVWHVGLGSPPPPGIAHHNIHFGADWAGAFDALLDDRTLMPDPSRLVTAPSVSDPTAAPEGGSTLYVLEPVPHLGSDLDWRTLAPAMRERLMTFLEHNNYGTDVVVDRLVTPDEWEAQGMHLGTPFALAHTFGQSGPFRPRNTTRKVPGLVFAGSGTTPGVGIPMVLMSGKHAAWRVEEHLGGGRR